MALSTETLDHHLHQRAGLLSRVMRLDVSVATGIIGLQEQLRVGKTTGIPLKDWALLAHGEHYQEFMKAAMQVGVYLAEHARASLPSLFAVYAERSPNKNSVRYDLHVGVLADGGMSVVPIEGTFQLQVPCSRVYQEQGDVGEHGRRQQGASVRQGPIVLDEVITPSFFRDAPHDYFSSETETAPYLFARLQAGTDAVRVYLREFWQGQEPPKAAEFFRSIAPSATEAQP